jgi:hypothetical protein
MLINLSVENAITEIQGKSDRYKFQTEFERIR